MILMALKLDCLRQRSSPWLSHSKPGSGDRSGLAGLLVAFLLVGGNGGDQALVERDLLYLARHVTQVDQEAVHLRHPHQRVLIQQAVQQPLGVEAARVQRLRDDAGLRGPSLAVLWPTLNRAHTSAVINK